MDSSYEKSDRSHQEKGDTMDHAKVNLFPFNSHIYIVGQRNEQSR